MKEDIEVPEELKQAARENAEKIRDSSVFLNLYSDDMVDEVIPLIQMGLAIYMNKPIILLVPEGVSVPENLLMVGKKIEYYKRGSEKSLKEATDRLMEWAAHEPLFL